MRIKLQIQDNLTGRRAVTVHNLRHIKWLIIEQSKPPPEIWHIYRKYNHIVTIDSFHFGCLHYEIFYLYDSLVWTAEKLTEIIKTFKKKNKICLFKFSYNNAQEKFLILNDAIESSRHVENKMLLHPEKYSKQFVIKGKEDIATWYCNLTFGKF